MLLTLVINGDTLPHSDRLVARLNESFPELVGILLNVKIPTVLPFLREAAITGLGIAWKSGIAAEVICNPLGSLGALLSGAKLTIDYEQVFAVTLTVVILSLILENILKICWKERKYD